MLFSKKTVVYLSSDETDYNLAKSLLEKEKILFYEFVSEEMPVCGCGARINPARLGKQNDLMIYRLSVNSEEAEKAVTVLQGNVKYVLNK